MMNSKSYKFNESQNQLILGLSPKMLFVSYFMMVGGLLGILSGLINVSRGGFAGIVQGVILLIGVCQENCVKAQITEANA